MTTFDLEQVADDVLLHMIDLAEQAPSRSNQHSRRWLIIRDPGLKKQIAELYRDAGIAVLNELKATAAKTDERGEQVLSLRSTSDALLCRPTVRSRVTSVPIAGEGRGVSIDLDINAIAVRLWSLVTAITIPGRFSKDAVSARRDGGEELGLGSSFHGSNACEDTGHPAINDVVGRVGGIMAWEAPCHVIRWEPGRAFAYDVGPDPDDPWAKWGFTLQLLLGGRTRASARMVGNFNHAADFLYGTAGLETYVGGYPDGRRALHYAVHKPAGVIGVIFPWNQPGLLLTWKVAPALAFGNAVVVKPSELTPSSATSSATLLGEVIAAAGIPDGIYNVVHGFGPNSAGEFLTKHPGLDAIAFTGESATGSTIMAAAPMLTPVSFELGGKERRARLRRHRPGPCRRGDRSLGLHQQRPGVPVHRADLRAAPDLRRVRLAARRAGRVVLPGPAERPTVNRGPLISHEHREKVQAYGDLAVKEGANIRRGGHALDMPGDLANGANFAPTIWTGLEQSARVVNEEVFGPVCHVMPFDTDDEAVALANDSVYGLAATL